MTDCFQPRNESRSSHSSWDIAIGHRPSSPRANGVRSSGGIELLDKPEQLTALHGTRLPHLWVEKQGQRLSTLDRLAGALCLSIRSGSLGRYSPPSSVRLR